MHNKSKKNNNTFFGYQSGDENTASNNTFYGMRSGAYTSSGGENVYMGYTAGQRGTTGANNVALGSGANFYNQTGGNNTIIGYQAGYGAALHNKSSNILIGYQAGYNETGSNKLYIENSNSATPLIWGDFSTDVVNFNGSVGIGTTEPVSKLHVEDGNYAQFEDNNAGAPAVGDCDSDTERGRMSIDTTNNRLYICNGATRGWDYTALTD